ncbi:MAG: carboxypeptidase M32 [Planctomycetota bacterium]|jgi:carboxypeptidase Taq
MATSTEVDTNTDYARLVELSRRAQLLGGTMELLGWDQEVLMPPGGLDYRARQMAELARLHHAAATDPRLGELLGACEGDSSLTADPTSEAAVNIRELRHDYDRRTRLPEDLVTEEARLTSLAQHEWAEARRDSDFARFRPWLEKVIDLMRRKAACYGWAEGGEPWDALAEDYEPGCTAAEVEQVFTPLRERLQALLSDLMSSGSAPSNAFNEKKLPIASQKKFVRFVAEAIGFDFTRGRLDTSTHPFCSGTHCNDIRMTTRFHDQNVNDALGSTMHESGHGIYEQGLLTRHIGTPMGQSVSLGIHESQSRMWENQVGRSRAFWQWCHPQLAEHFGDAVADLDLDTVYGGANIVRPDFIRVEADEATYNMHIMVRFELERALLAGDLEAADVPGVWNEKYREYLGLDVPDDRRGCLQDVHWSMASMGYFPTYTLGNLYSAQLFEQALADIPDLHEQFARGEFDALKTWLNERIHAQGRRYRAADLCEHVTGRPLSPDPLLRHLEGKLKPLYGA